MADIIEAPRERLVRAPNNEDGEPMRQIVQDTDYIEQLERAVITQEQEIPLFECPICAPRPWGAGKAPAWTDNGHVADCIIPQLIAKYADA